MSMRAIDLNADLGEGVGDDEAMLTLVTSANVACGFHAGTPVELLATCRAATHSGVRVGAQVSYPDRAGFGRRFMDISPAELTADILYQIGALDAIARAAGTTVSYVKPHGALYNTIVTHERQAQAVIAALHHYDGMALMGLPGSLALSLARQAEIPVITEAFADRAYTPQATLVPRGQPGAVLLDTEQIASRVVELVTSGTLTAIDGTRIEIHADSICLHGDTPGAVEHARAVRDALRESDIEVRAAR
ncbi:MAG: 5-oxoprolinase subunit PxpA [Gordonia sp. (in: high G+C Gram-positive bacteria)]